MIVKYDINQLNIEKTSFIRKKKIVCKNYNSIGKIIKNNFICESTLDINIDLA